jgi:hypothetical protein
MSDPVTSPSYRAIGEEPSGASALLRHVLPLLLVAVVAVGFLAPQVLGLFLAMDGALRATAAALARAGIVDGARGVA